MKTCTKCGETKGLEEFHRERARSDGLRPWCKTCTHASNNARAVHTRERKSEYDRRRRAELHDQLIEWKRSYYRANRDRIASAARARRAECPERTVWVGMIARCTRPSAPAFPRYGGRGITVCDRWRESFENFLTDMGPKPSPAHSLDRIDNDGPYSPENCRWATAKEQSRNKRTNFLLTIDGATKTVAEWAELFGVDPHRAYHRLHSGWDPVRAFTTPSQVSA